MMNWTRFSYSAKRRSMRGGVVAFSELWLWTVVLAEDLA